MQGQDTQLDVLIDMDGILAACVDSVLELYNKEKGTNWTTDDIVDPDIDKIIKDKYIYQIFGSPEFFYNLKVMDGAQEFVKRVINYKDPVTHKKTFEVYILTAHFNSNPYSPSDKLRWLYKHFPFVKQNNIIFCHQKYMVKGDILIDDTPKKVFAWQNHHSGNVLTIAHPYNTILKDCVNVYAPDHHNTKQAYDLMMKHLVDNQKELLGCKIKALEN